MRFEEGDWSWQAKDNEMILVVRRIVQTNNIISEGKDGGKRKK